MRLRKTQPCATLQQIADSVGVSRQRVHQILSSAGVATRKKRTSLRPLCAREGCPNRLDSKHRVYCSMGCRDLDKHISVSCSWCGKLFPMLASSLIWKIANGQKYFSCSNECKMHLIARLPRPNAMSHRERVARIQKARELLQAGAKAKDISDRLEIHLLTAYSYIQEIKQEEGR